MAGRAVVIVANHLSYADANLLDVLIRRSIDTARDRLREGAALLVFGEGTRSRTGRMQRMLPGAARYFEESSAWVLPMGIAGTEALFPIGSERLRQSDIVVRVGRPFEAGRLIRNAGRDRRRAMDGLGCAVADLVPLAYRGAYGGSDGDAVGRLVR